MAYDANDIYAINSVEESRFFVHTICKALFDLLWKIIYNFVFGCTHK